MKVLSKIIFFLIGLSSVHINAQTGKPFVYRNIINEPDGIVSATVMSNGKFAYAQAGDDIFSIHIIDTGGNELLSRKFIGSDLSECKLIYHKGYIYGITNNTIDGDSQQRKFNIILFKLDTCLNIVAAKQVYNNNPLFEYMYIQTNYWNNPEINNKEEFFFSLANVFKPKGWYAGSNILVVFDTLLNVQFSPYYPALETIQTSFYNGMYQMSGFYEQLNADSSLYLMKPFYSELNLETKECNMWVIEQMNESAFGFLSGFLDPTNHKMYASLLGYSGRGYSHGVVDYSNLDAAKYTIMCDTSMWSSCEKIVYNWGKKNQITMIELSDFKNATDQYAYTTVRTFNNELAETGSKKIHGWGNLKNGLDDTFTMLTLGTTVLTNNKLFVFGLLRDENYTARSFYYVLDSNLNFATKTIDPDKYHCSKNKVLPPLVIVPKDTFLLTNEMFEPAKVIVHNIKIKQLDLIAGLPFNKPLVVKKSKHMLIKYLPDNHIECEIKGQSAQLEYVLYDLSGKKILDGKVFDNKIIISPNDLIPGVYTISIVKNMELFTEKIVVQ